MKRNVIIATLAAAGVAGGAVLAGTAIADDSGDPAPSSTRTLNTGADSDGSDDSRKGKDDGAKDRAGSWVSAEQAVARALDAEPGDAYKLELEEDDRVWEVDILTEDGKTRQVDVARKGGEIVANKADDKADDKEEAEDDRREAKQVRAALEKANTSLGDAARIAVQKVPGTIGEIELEQRGTVWEVDFDEIDGKDGGRGKDVELHVDVDSGKATLHEDKHDDRDDHHEHDGHDDH